MVVESEKGLARLLVAILIENHGNFLIYDIANMDTQGRSFSVAILAKLLY